MREPSLGAEGWGGQENERGVWAEMHPSVHVERWGGSLQKVVVACSERTMGYSGGDAAVMVRACSNGGAASWNRLCKRIDMGSRSGYTPCSGPRDIDVQDHSTSTGAAAHIPRYRRASRLLTFLHRG
jgi:hypothetical protein